MRERADPAHIEVMSAPYDLLTFDETEDVELLDTHIADHERRIHALQVQLDEYRTDRRRIIAAAADRVTSDREVLALHVHHGLRTEDAYDRVTALHPLIEGLDHWMFGPGDYRAMVPKINLLDRRDPSQAIALAAALVRFAERFGVAPAFAPDSSDRYEALRLYAGRHAATVVTHQHLGMSLHLFFTADGAQASLVETGRRGHLPAAVTKGTLVNVLRKALRDRF